MVQYECSSTSVWGRVEPASGSAGSWCALVWLVPAVWFGCGLLGAPLVQSECSSTSVWGRLGPASSNVDSRCRLVLAVHSGIELLQAPVMRFWFGKTREGGHCEVIP